MVLVLLAAATMQVFPLSHFFAHPCFHSPHKSSNFVMPNAYKMIMDFFFFTAIFECELSGQSGVSSWVSKVKGYEM